MPASYTFYKNDGTSVREQLPIMSGTTFPDPNADFGWSVQGKTFKGWNTKSDGSGTFYYIDDTISFGYTFYAIWESPVIMYLTTDRDLTSIANAIRTKRGTSAQLAFPQGFVDAVEAVEIGGGDNAVFALKDFVIGPNKWTAQNDIPNVLKTGGCLHIVFTMQTNSSSSGLSIFSFGVGALSQWSPGTSNPSCYINASANSADVQMYVRGVGNDAFNLTSHADSNGKVDLKLYSDRFVDVNTGETGNYNTNTQACMAAIAQKNYISVGQNQSNTYQGFVLTLAALEEQ